MKMVMNISSGRIECTVGAIVALTLASGGSADELPRPEAEALLDYMQQEDYKENWSYWPGKEALYEGAEPHGALLTTYVNDSAHEALTDGAEVMPVGSIIVKENYSQEKKLGGATVMYKAPEGYNPEHNDWFWVKYTPSGDAEASGKVDGCQSCHQASENDYLMTPLP